MIELPKTPSAEESRRTLVVIDMQPAGFPAAGWIRREVIKEIEDAIARQDGVVFVRYAIPYAGEIDSSVLEIAAGYERATQVDKLHENGSVEVIEGCRQLPVATLRLCGVTTDDCVTKTAHGLATLLPASRIEVVQSACSCSISNFDWTNFSQAPNVFVV